jgi:hypothetical protein
VVRDICDREPWPFQDNQFDFVVCSQTLEDVRDPVAVCEELVRVGKAGYIEVPSRLEEQTFGIQGPWVGWGHHHWLVDVSPGEIEFVFKHHIVHGPKRFHLPAGSCDGLPAEERVETLWWEGSFAFRERIFSEPEELSAYLADFVAAQQGIRPRGGLRRRLGRLRVGRG